MVNKINHLYVKSKFGPSERHRSQNMAAHSSHLMSNFCRTVFEAIRPTDHAMFKYKSKLQLFHEAHDVLNESSLEDQSERCRE